MRDEVFQDCYNHWTDSDGNKPFWADLAEKWGYRNGEHLRSSFKSERRKRGVVPKGNLALAQAENNIYKEDDKAIYITTSSEVSKTKQEIIDEYNIDTDVWELGSYEVKTSWGYRKDKQTDWVSKNGVATGTSKDSGKLILVKFYNTRAKFIRKTLAHISVDDVKRIIEDKKITIPNIAPKSYAPLGECLEVNVMDLHFGSDANHSPEKRFGKAIDDVVKRIGKRSFSKIYLCLLGDIFHYDNLNRTTASGTIVTTNSMTAYEVLDLAVTVFVENVLKLASLVPIEILFVPGNHDPMNGYALVKILEAFFKDNDNIEIDTGHKSRKYRLIGNSLIGWMHGEMPKSRASQWLQVEASQEWGKSKYREIHSGNFHSQETKEDGGVILRYLPGMTDIDEWHYSKGYVGAVKAMVSFVWDVDEGLREQWFTSVNSGV